MKNVTYEAVTLRLSTPWVFDATRNLGNISGRVKSPLGGSEVRPCFRAFEEAHAIVRLLLSSLQASPSSSFFPVGTTRHTLPRITRQGPSQAAGSLPREWHRDTWGARMGA